MGKVHVYFIVLCLSVFYIVPAGAEAVEAGKKGVGNWGGFKLSKAVFELQGTMSGTLSCKDPLNGSTKKKFKSEAIFILDDSQFPLVTANVILAFGSYDMTGVALFKNNKRGVIQLFGNGPGSSDELALSGNFKINTGIWMNLKGKFQHRIEGADVVCIYAGKFKAK